MVNHMVICYNQKRAVMFLHRLCHYLYSKGIKFKANHVSDIVDIMDGLYVVRFISVEKYYSMGRIGYHGNVVDELDVERLLDELEAEKTLNGKT